MSVYDPVAEAKAGGISDPIQFLTVARSTSQPWVVYGPGCVVSEATLDADDVTRWRAQGMIGAAYVAPAPPAPVISNVVATPDAADGTQCTITWTTDIAADSQVHYGATSSYGSSSVLEPGTVTSHTVTLTGLTAATTYHYAVASGGTTSPDGTFTTA